MQLVNQSFLIKEVAQQNKKSKKKCSIVLLSSIYGLVGQDISIYKNTKVSENLSYTITKGALINFTRQMSSFYTRFGIRTNCVCPEGYLINQSVKVINFIKIFCLIIPKGVP